MTTLDSGARAVRSHLIDALEADLVGPFRKPPRASISDAPEVLRIPPSRWYLTGFLVPRDQGEIHEPDEEDDDVGAGNDEDDTSASRLGSARTGAGCSRSAPSLSPLTMETGWLPRVEVLPVEARKLPEVAVQMKAAGVKLPHSMVGLYEGAVLTLAPKAKLVASTATVRRSQQQVLRLYGRPVALFPPPGVDASETFLTSREKTADIKAAKNRLELPHGQPKSVDVVLASNMISVGVDIDRLGLMVVAGQPKTTSEYIQASSRVGRNANKPGLVVTCLNAAKPRDRSHYERFGAYHASFYRFVEATSVTPFSAPALDRGLAGVVVALGRLLNTTMTAPLEVKSLDVQRAGSGYPTKRRSVPTPSCCSARRASSTR